MKAGSFKMLDVFKLSHSNTKNFMACPQQLLALKAILNTYADSTGLKVNYAKSIMVLINVPPERLIHLAATFQC
jgi:hypothetical protein